jgi:hypothetical protein
MWVWTESVGLRIRAQGMLLWEVTVQPEMKGIFWPGYNQSWSFSIQSVPGRKVNILGSHSIGHSEEKYVYK